LVRIARICNGEEKRRAPRSAKRTNGSGTREKKITYLLEKLMVRRAELGIKWCRPMDTGPTRTPVFSPDLSDVVWMADTRYLAALMDILNVG